MNIVARPSLVARSWQRIETWFKTFAPAALAQLRPGVTQAAIQEVENRLGMRLPADLKASCRFHNGTASESLLLLGEFDLYSLEAVADLREQTAQEPSRPPSWVAEGRRLPVQPLWWYPAWLDIAWGEAGGIGRPHLCLDLAPAAGGNYGQILAWSDDGSVREVLFPSFEVLLRTFADQLEAGLYVLHQPLPFVLRHHPSLAQRRAAFRERTAAKAALEQAIRSGWELAEATGIKSGDEMATQAGQAPLTSLDFQTALEAVDSSESEVYYHEEEMLFTYAQGGGSEDLSAYEREFDHCVALYRAVLQMPEATVEDRCFAYYGWLSLYASNGNVPSESIQMLLEQWQEEAEHLPPTHWGRQEVTSLKQWYK